MDVDGQKFNAQASDVDQNLLRLFSCMNTSDRDELISQLQKLVGPNIDNATASFFLDMCNWNLQEAVGLYLDYSATPKLPAMSVVAVKSYEEPIPPGSCFEHSWTITNTGADTWPGGCQVVHAGGEKFESVPTFVANLPPGHSTTVYLRLTAPMEAQKHLGYFNLTTDRGEKFGDTLWVVIVTGVTETEMIADQMARMYVPNQHEVTTQTTSDQQQWDDQMC